VTGVQTCALPILWFGFIAWLEHACHPANEFALIVFGQQEDEANRHHGIELTVEEPTISHALAPDAQRMTAENLE